MLVILEAATVPLNPRSQNHGQPQRPSRPQWAPQGPPSGPNANEEYQGSPKQGAPINPMIARTPRAAEDIAEEALGGSDVRGGLAPILTLFRAFWLPVEDGAWGILKGRI